ncbi:MAG: fumarate hydratase, partial [Bacteroidales bacterium]
MIMEFKYQEMFPLGKDKTEYHFLTKNYVSTIEFEGEQILKVDPEGLRFLAKQAMHDVSFMLRPAHNEMVAKILDDSQASVNDKAV